jgi:hypothetical protein
VNLIPAASTSGSATSRRVNGDPQCIEVKRINVSGAFYLSIEFQGTGFLVERLYKTAYGDANGISTDGGPHQVAVPIVKFSEFLPDTQEIGRGVVVGATGWEAALEAKKVAFTDQFVQRARFLNAYPLSMTPAQFVDALNANAGNPLSPAERDQLVSDLTGRRQDSGAGPAGSSGRSGSDQRRV